MRLVAGHEPGPIKALEKRSTSELELVVPIQAHGAGIPLFLIAADLYAVNIARGLGPKRPLFGLRVPNPELDEQLPPRTIEQIAADCVRALRRERPKGPYALGGWCKYGVVALEMAHQLESEGQQVAFVALFDARTVFPPSASGPKRVMMQCVHFAQRVAVFASQVRSQGLATLHGAVADRVKKANDARERSRRGLRPSHNVLIEQSLRNYRPRPWTGRIVHLWARERPRGMFRDPEFAWNHLSPRGFIFYEVPGDHNSMMFDPALGEILAAELDLHAESGANPQGALTPEAFRRIRT